MAMGPGALINLDVLREEFDMLNNGVGFIPDLLIDRCATIIEEEHHSREAGALMRARIGSTTEGIGAARSDKIMRLAKTAEMAPDTLWDRGHVIIKDVSHELNKIINGGGGILKLEPVSEA